MVIHLFEREYCAGNFKGCYSILSNLKALKRIDIEVDLTH